MEERTGIAERELRQVLFTRLVGKLHRNFRTFTFGDECKPYRPGVQVGMMFAFGLLGSLAGHGELAGTVYLEDLESGENLVSLPFKSRIGMASNQKLIEELALSIAAYLGRCARGDSEARLEVSWQEG